MRSRALLAVGFALMAAWPAQAETLIQLIYEKRVVGDPKTGLIPINQLVMTPTAPPPASPIIPLSQAEAPNASTRPPLWQINGALRKRYRIAGPYQSEIWAESGNKLIKRIPVARQARHLLAAHNRLYVLCGGYVGTVWEIDPETDLVTRRFSVPGEAHHLYLDKGDLVVTGYRQDRIQLASGHVQPQTNVGPLPPHQGKSQWTLNVPPAPVPPSGDLLVVAHKNQDFLQVVDPLAGIIRALIPLDAPADDLFVRADRRYAYVWHRPLGQVTVVDLTGGAGHLSIVGRWQDPALNGQPVTLVESATGIHLWHNGVVASIGFKGLEAGQPGGAVSHPKEQVHLDRARAQRFFVQRGRLWRETLPTPGDLAPPQPKDLLVGESVDSMALSIPTGQLVAADPAGDQVWLLSLENPDRRLAVPVGPGPSDLVMSRDGQQVYVLAAQEGSVARLDLTRQRVENLVPLMAAEPLTLRLWDNQYRQEIRIHMPLYSQHAYVMRPL